MRSLPSDYTAALPFPCTLCRAWESIALPSMLEAFGLQGIEHFLGIRMEMRTRLWGPVDNLLSPAVCCGFVPSVPIHELRVAAAKRISLIRAGRDAREDSRR